MNNDDDDSCSSGSEIGAFATLDLTGVDFDKEQGDNDDFLNLTASDKLALKWDSNILWDAIDGGDDGKEQNMPTSPTSLLNLKEAVTMIKNGEYINVLCSESARRLFSSQNNGISQGGTDSSSTTMWQLIQQQLLTRLQEDDTKAQDSQQEDGLSPSPILSTVLEAECIAIAALSLFLQLNYTGPMIDSVDEDLAKLSCPLHPSQYYPKDSNYNTMVFSELAVDGIWPCQVAQGPYLLLISRAILQFLSYNSQQSNASASSDGAKNGQKEDIAQILSIQPLQSVQDIIKQYCNTTIPIWSGRAVVAHERLLLLRDEPSRSLWSELETLYPRSIQQFRQEIEKSADGDDSGSIPDVSDKLATIYLEYALAHVHFERDENSGGDHTEGYKSMLDQSRGSSGLIMEITGAMGKRTKFQTKATAQYVVRAQSKSFMSSKYRQPETKSGDAEVNEEVTGQGQDNDTAASSATGSPPDGDMMVPHTDDTVFLEQIKFEDTAEQDLANTPLTILDQAIILGYCLVVKTKNPSSDDILTGEEMLAYLARVLAVQHSHQQKLLKQQKEEEEKGQDTDTNGDTRNSLVDWMVYATALLERAWLEFDNTHTKERALLQLQALADQHTNRLTLTQSTMKSITEDSSPVQERLKYVHGIVYPPQWKMKHDLATRYASLGIVTSAAELFTTVEDWDSVVECYKRAGKENLAKEVVERQLKDEKTATPRMWTALGDLTNDPKHYERAIELSNGRFAQAYISLGKYHFEKGEIELTAEYYRKALHLRPLIPYLWFKVGTISMQLQQWDNALQAFSEVVQQEPTEHEAWANVAAIHMHNKNPAAAYPALSEVRKSSLHSKISTGSWTSRLIFH